jgi:enoyl-CoA hydratase/carnithine racemase
MNDELPVLFEEREVAGGRRIGFAKLNRPKQLNALTLEMCQLMLDRFRAWASDEGIVAVMLEGAGPKGFSAGGDVATVIKDVREGGPRRYVYGDAFFDVEYTLDLLIHRYPKPLISWSHGVCMGGGVGLAVGASHRIVSEGSRIAMPEIHIGLFPDVGGGWFLNRVPGGAGTVMALTGMIINEADALFAGLADVFIPEEARGEFNEALLALDWSGEPQADRERLSRLCLSRHRRYKAGLPVSNLQQYFDAIRFIAAQPTVTAVRDALLAAADEDPYFRAPADNLAKGSPTAAHVTFEYLRRTRQMSIEQVLALDLILARNFQRRDDFREGVRSLLIDKDRNPKWSPARFEDVDEALIASHFRE